jgi:prepilin-type N-terminal cleavage/methylation domain-containing protein
MFKSKGEKGFTLIEILIVVAIIGMLSSIVLVGLGSFRSRGRDARRAADLREIQNALELYYARYGSYPNPYNNENVVSLGLPSKGIGVTKIPADPGDGIYRYGSNGKSYVLGATLEEQSAAILSDDIDNDSGTELFGVSCDDPVYCIKF